MALKFGTSGVRGLVEEMTDLACYHYVTAFIRLLQVQTPCRKVCLAGDHRNSSPRIMAAVAAAIVESGFELEYGGTIPTPAIALYAMNQGAAAIMVTGSHIPEDRNGIKFYMPWGEILKAEEVEISQWYQKLDATSYGDKFDSMGMLTSPFELPIPIEGPTSFYIKRYTDAFQEGCLKGKKIVFYQHSSVARTILDKILLALGAEVICVGWSEQFIPVDTEAVEHPERLAAWVHEYGADALLSTDGDADRPLLVDDQGRVIRGDILGILAAQWLKAEAVVLPVSCNTALEISGVVEKVTRTKIGSPYVIEAMNQWNKKGVFSVVGYEANGGFLTGSALEIPPVMGKISALPTRDAVLPLLVALLSNKGTLSSAIAALPVRRTCSGLLKGIETDRSQEFIKALRSTRGALLGDEFKDLGPCQEIDETDGFRIKFASGNILHFRPSGNAPEFRCYAESESDETAQGLIECALRFLTVKLRN